MPWLYGYVSIAMVVAAVALALTLFFDVPMSSREPREALLILLACATIGMAWPAFVVGSLVCWLGTSVATWHNRRVLDRWVEKTFPVER